MRKLKLLVAASLIAGTTLVMGPVQHASACAPDPDGVDPCQTQTCNDLNARLYKFFHQDLLACAE